MYFSLSQDSRRISRYLSSIANQMTSEEDYDELQKFVKDKQKYLKEIKQGVEQSLETVKLNVQWQKRHLSDVENLLKDFAEKKSSKP